MEAPAISSCTSTLQWNKLISQVNFMGGCITKEGMKDFVKIFFVLAKAIRNKPLKISPTIILNRFDRFILFSSLFYLEFKA